MAKIALVGEAYGEDEERESAKAGHPVPFVGAAGKMLDTLLRAAGIDRGDCLVTNVFNLRPEDNDELTLFGPKSKGVTDLPPLRNSKYLLPEYRPELDRLRQEIAEAAVVVPLGATACWAVTGYGNVGARRGGWHEATRAMPTYHPALVLRQYQWFPLVVSDLVKAKGLADGRIQPNTFDLIPRPSFDETIAFLAGASRQHGPIVFDIETSPKFRAITCIGIGYAGRFLCIPFADDQSTGFSYWPTAEEELEVWRAIRRCLETPGIPKIAHHSTYDLTWLWTIAGIRVQGPVYDTRIIHHSLLPELPHSLGSIAHTYFVLPPWKALRKAAKDAEE